jgi:phasin family protein
MYPFAQSVTPAVRDHMQAQVSFFNDLSKSMFRSIQQMSSLNLQLTQTMLEESTMAAQSLLTADKPTEALSAAALRAQPATEKLRAFQQHLARVAADSQVDLSHVAEQHLKETIRTAEALAEEVARVAEQETEKSMHDQQEAAGKSNDPFTQSANAASQQRAMRGNGAEARGSSNMQSGGQGSQAGQAQGEQGHPAPHDAGRPGSGQHA